MVERATSVIELLQQMVRTPSVTGDEAALGDALFDLARRWKIDAQRLPLVGHPDQIVLTVEPTRPDAKWLLLDSHLDTVAVEGMTIDPFGGSIEGGKLLGRGACDTKGTGAAMLWALRNYAEQPDRPQGAAMLLSVAEETDMAGIAAFVERDLANLPFRPAAAIVGEPTNFHPVVAHNGLVRWEIVTRGVAAHSSTPHDGRSAISAMVKVVAALEHDYIAKLTADHDLTGPAVCSVNLIRGGSADNIIPDRCTIAVDRRLTPDEDADAEGAKVDRLLETLGEPVERSVLVQHPPLTTRRNAQLVERTVAVLGEMGLPQMKLGAPFATHAAYLDAAGIPTVVIGPGDPRKAHTKDEFVETAQIERGVELYERLIRAAV